MRPWKRCLPRRSPLAALLPVLLPALAGCSSAPGVVVDIGAWPEGATTLRVESTLNGAVAREPLSFTNVTTRFVLYLPEGSSGELGLKLSAHDADECLRASGQTRIEVGGSKLRPITEAHAPLSAISPRSCPGPAIDGINPTLASTAGGTVLEVTGQRILQGARLSIDGAAATDVSVLSPTRLRATLPRRLGAFGLVPVLLQNPDGQSAMRGDLFSYYANQVAFSTMTSIDAGASTNPTGVAVADVNNDGKPDLLSSDGNDSVRVFLGDGTGGFGAFRRFTAGPNPTSLILGDWNGDKNVDVAAITYGNNSVALLIGDGTGGFGSIPSLGVSAPSRLAQGDFNGDGFLDLAVSGYYSNTVNVWLGNGRGGFGSPTQFGVGTNPGALAVADFNGDKRSDLAVTSSMGSDVNVLLGDGRGGFAAAVPYATDRNSGAVTAGDFNGDSIVDLAVASFGTGNVGILLGDGRGAFGPATNIREGSALYDITTADFDGDRRLDLVVSSGDANRVTVLLGDGKGGFGAVPSLSAGQSARSVAVADLNGDRKPDVVCSNYFDRSLSTFLNQSQ